MLGRDKYVLGIEHIVSNLSYAGDEGGIVCHIASPDKEEALVVSLTQVRVPRSMPLAAAVADYHDHRVKKLKKPPSSRQGRLFPPFCGNPVISFARYASTSFFESGALR